MGIEPDWNGTSVAGNLEEQSSALQRNNSSIDTLAGNTTPCGSPPNKSLDTYLWIYISPIILILGVCGNSLTIAVSRRRRLQSSTAGMYLQLMATADLCVLIVGIFPDWLTACNFVTLRCLHPWVCKLEKFLSYTSGDVAIWLIVAFTSGRVIAVCFPLMKNRVCTVKRASILSGVILVLCMAKNVPELWLRGLQYQNKNGEMHLTSYCGYITASAVHYGTFIRPWIAFSLINAIPFCLILAFNIAIVKTLLKMKQMGSISTKDKSYHQTTIMCLSASILFLICITPSIVLLIGKPYWTDDGKGNYAYDIAKAVNNQLVYINHSMNFFLYCLTGRKFREELIAMVKGEKSFSSKSSASIYNANRVTTRKDSKQHLNGMNSISMVSGLQNSTVTYEETVSAL